MRRNTIRHPSSAVACNGFPKARRTEDLSAFIDHRLAARVIFGRGLFFVKVVHRVTRRNASRRAVIALIEPVAQNSPVKAVIGSGRGGGPRASRGTWRPPMRVSRPARVTSRNRRLRISGSRTVRCVCATGISARQGCRSDTRSLILTENSRLRKRIPVRTAVLHCVTTCWRKSSTTLRSTSTISRVSAQWRYASTTGTPAKLRQGLRVCCSATRFEGSVGCLRKRWWRRAGPPQTALRRGPSRKPSD